MAGQISDETSTGKESAKRRSRDGSMSDPLFRQPCCNRTFELKPDTSDTSDSAQSLVQMRVGHSYHVAALRLPGFVTALSGLNAPHRRDVAAAEELRYDIWELPPAAAQYKHIGILLVYPRLQTCHWILWSWIIYRNPPVEAVRTVWMSVVRTKSYWS